MREATIDFNTVDSNGPHDPERVVELALVQLATDVAAAKTQSRDAFKSGRDAILAVSAADNAMTAAPKALEDIARERFKQLMILCSDDLDETDAARIRLVELSKQDHTLRGLVTDVGQYHLSQFARYYELGDQLEQFINILPNVERQVRLARIAAWFIRAGFFLLAFVLAFILERFAGDRVEWVFDHLWPEHAKDATIAFFYLLVLLAIDKPSERRLQKFQWWMFERIKGAREKELKRIEEIKTSLNRLAHPSALSRPRVPSQPGVSEK